MKKIREMPVRDDCLFCNGLTNYYCNERGFFSHKVRWTKTGRKDDWYQLTLEDWNKACIDANRSQYCNMNPEENESIDAFWSNLYNKEAAKYRNN